MKKICIYISLFWIGLTACSDFLEEKPYGVYSNQNYYNTEADALSALLYAYSPINYIEYGARFLFYLTDVTTNQYKNYGRVNETNLYIWDCNPNTDEFLYFFKYAYLSINRANSVLENVVKMNNIDLKNKNQILGEAYFLRAFNYFMLVRTYGKVPLRVKSVQGSNETNAPLASIETIYTLIIEDLEASISLCGISKHQGRADKVGAQALLSKVYLTLASSKMTGAPGYEWVEDGEAMYAKAAQYAGEVVNEQTTYSLDPDLLRVYDVNHFVDGSEHIFITSMNREASGMEGSYSQTPQMFGISLPVIWISSSLTGGTGVQKVIDGNQSCWSVFRVDADFYDTFDDLDLRKKLMVSTIYNENGTVLATWSRDNINSSNPTENAFYHPFCRKYTDPASLSNRTSANIYLIRFAEVALTYAEAAGPTQEGYKWVNAVRERAGLGELTPGLDKTAFREAIWKELTFELAFEGHGLFELRRINRVMQEITNKQVKEEYAYFFPIPQREQDLNKQ